MMKLLTSVEHADETSGVCGQDAPIAAIANMIPPAHSNYK